LERVTLFGGVVPLARSKAQLAPIYVDDVADAFVRALKNRSTFGETYELCGPHTMTLADMVRLIARAAKHNCFILPMPDFFPGSKGLPLDAVCKDNGCERLGITPRHMEGIVPLYLNFNRPR
jgi:NADH dehydrogenase